MRFWTSGVVTVAAAAVAVATAPSAIAADGPHLRGLTLAVAEDPLRCGAGAIEYGMSSGDPSGWAVLGMHVYFAGLEPLLNIYANNSCRLHTTLHWRNTDTGASGAQDVFLTGAGPKAAMPAAEICWFRPGPGNVVVTVTTYTPHTVRTPARAPIS
ncbi:hypothetical protein [Nocardia sp. NPDC003345]